MNPSSALEELARQSGECSSCDMSLVPEGDGYQERPCVKVTPFFTKWCKSYNNGKGYPAGSIVVDPCGMYLTLVHETRSPREANSSWVQFTGLAFTMMFAEWLASKTCTVEEGVGEEVPADEECVSSGGDGGGNLA